MIRSLRERFESFVDRTSDPDGHHLWIGHVNSNGYGKISDGGRDLYAHRLALVWKTGSTGEGMDAAHDDAAGCPRHCVNPAHLSWKTHTENMNDVKRKHGRLFGKAPRAYPLLDLTCDS